MTMCNNTVSQTCSNCLNAYNSPWDVDVHCVNLEFDEQFDPSVTTTVKAEGSCGRWSRRKPTQPRLDFHRSVQLTLFG